jgi:hypothetical protein
MKRSRLVKASWIVVSTLLILVAGLRRGSSSEPSRPAPVDLGLETEAVSKDDDPADPGTPEQRYVRLIDELEAEIPTVFVWAPSLTFQLFREDYGKKLATALKLGDSQRDQIERLQKLVCEGHVAARRREVESLRAVKKPTRETIRQVFRLMDENRKRRADAIEVGDRFILLSILGPAQAEILKRFRWKAMGVDALQDPELAERLQLSREQRRLLKQRATILEQVVKEESTPVKDLAKDSPELGEHHRRGANRVNEALQFIRDVLSPEQVELLNRIIDV